MSETPYNPDDPAFLLSRSLDEKLSEEEQEALDRALASSETLRAEAARLRSLDRLVKRWGNRPIELDWEHYSALTEAQLVHDGDADKLRQVDLMLDKWASQTVSIDAEAFTTAVMAGVRAERKAKSWHRVVFRLGVPLAAAAAVVFAVTGTLWLKPDSGSECRIEIGYAQHMGAPSDGSADLPEPVVVFGQVAGSQKVASASSARTSSGVSFIAIGASRIRVGAADLPP